jgi:hypothetical protein
MSLDKKPNNLKQQNKPFQVKKTMNWEWTRGFSCNHCTGDREISFEK